MSYFNNHDFPSLIGETIVKVEGLEPGSDRVCLYLASGGYFLMRHDMDCCESVAVEDVVGDVADLIGTVVDAREDTNDSSHPEGKFFDYEPQSFTWTFYIIQTNKGAVTIRWLGESNGYYSEAVDFERYDENGRPVASDN